MKEDDFDLKAQLQAYERQRILFFKFLDQKGLEQEYTEWMISDAPKKPRRIFTSDFEKEEKLI